MRVRCECAPQPPPQACRKNRSLFKLKRLSYDTVCFPQDIVCVVHRLTRSRCRKWWRTLINTAACAGLRGGKAARCFPSSRVSVPKLIYHSSLRLHDLCVDLSCFLSSWKRVHCSFFSPASSCSFSLFILSAKVLTSRWKAVALWNQASCIMNK